MMSKCSIFKSAISSSIFGGSDWTLAESTLSVFGCVCVSRCGGGGGDSGGGVVVDGGDDGDGGEVGGGDFGGEECINSLFMGLPLELEA